jgi:hypothetical protein
MVFAAPPAMVIATSPAMTSAMSPPLLFATPLATVSSLWPGEQQQQGAHHTHPPIPTQTAAPERQLGIFEQIVRPLAYLEPTHQALYHNRQTDGECQSCIARRYHLAVPPMLLLRPSDGRVASPHPRQQLEVEGEERRLSHMLVHCSHCSYPRDTRRTAQTTAVGNTSSNSITPIPPRKSSLFSIRRPLTASASSTSA